MLEHTPESTLLNQGFLQPSLKGPKPGRSPPRKIRTAQILTGCSQNKCETCNKNGNFSLGLYIFLSRMPSLCHTQSEIICTKKIQEWRSFFLIFDTKNVHHIRKTATAAARMRTVQLVLMPLAAWLHQWSKSQKHQVTLS